MLVLYLRMPTDIILSQCTENFPGKKSPVFVFYDNTITLWSLCFIQSQNSFERSWKLLFSLDSLVFVTLKSFCYLNGLPQQSWTCKTTIKVKQITIRNLKHVIKRCTAHRKHIMSHILRNQPGLCCVSSLFVYSNAYIITDNVIFFRLSCKQ